MEKFGFSFHVKSENGSLWNVCNSVVTLLCRACVAFQLHAKTAKKRNAQNLVKIKWQRFSGTCGQETKVLYLEFEDHFRKVASVFVVVT